MHYICGVHFHWEAVLTNSDNVFYCWFKLGYDCNLGFLDENLKCAKKHYRAL